MTEAVTDGDLQRSATDYDCLIKFLALGEYFMSVLGCLY